MPPPRDITHDFTVAASALSTGELIKDDFFSLAESVGALEIMDPKMDSGCLEPGETLDAEYNFLRELSAAQVIGVIDDLLTYETGWQQGNALAQTVFSCLYIDKILWPVPKTLSEAVFHRANRDPKANDLVDVVLRSYCCAVVKTCDLIQQQVTREQYYEEEDFAGHLYRRELLTRVQTSEVEELLAAAATHIENDAEIKDVERHAITHRIQFRQHLLAALSAGAPDGRDKACISWNMCQELTNKMRESSELGIPVHDAFSPKVQRKLASSNPPRPVVHVSLEIAFNHMARMCADAATAFSVLDCTNAMDIVTFLLCYMAKKPQPNVYVRCLMQSLVYDDGVFIGRYSKQELIYRDLKNLVVGANILVEEENAAAEAPQSARFQIARTMHTFAEAASHSFADLTRCLCMNRSRMRRMLAHTLNDWENLQFEAEDVDVKLRQYTDEAPLIDRLGSGEELWSYPLSSWVYTYKLKQMEWIVQLGFELDIYMLDELPSMYWYLRYLADTRLQHLIRVQAFARRSFDLRKSMTSIQAETFAETFANLDFILTDTRATATFAEALFNLYQAMVLAKIIPQTPRPYGTDDFRHNLRLKPFLPISLPSVPSRAEVDGGLIEGIDSLAIGNDAQANSKAVKLLQVADQLSKTAKKHWDWMSKQPARTAQCNGCEDSWRKKTKDVLKSIISTGILVASVRATITEFTSELDQKPSVKMPDTSYHEWWLIPKLEANN